MVRDHLPAELGEILSKKKLIITEKVKKIGISREIQKYNSPYNKRSIRLGS